MPESIKVRDDAHWRELRTKHVGASEIAALFALHPHVTKYELWHRKKGNLAEPDLSENERVFWGQTLEPAIAAGVAAKTGWNVRKVHRYLRHDAIPGFGATLDYEIHGHDRGPGVLEIKALDRGLFHTWEEGDPPMNFELQLQHQLAAINRGWGAFGVLVGGNELHVITRDRHDGAVERVEDAVTAFWQSIGDDDEPDPDFLLDADAIAQLYSDVAGGSTINAHDDVRLHEVCAEYVKAGAMERSGANAKKAAKSEILTRIGDAHRALCNEFKVSAGWVDETPVHYVKKGYRNFRVTEKAIDE